jgi:hypothetical protein
MRRRPTRTPRHRLRRDVAGSHYLDIRPGDRRNVCCWHDSDLPGRPPNVGYRGQLGRSSDSAEGPRLTHKGRRPSQRLSAADVQTVRDGRVAREQRLTARKLGSTALVACASRAYLDQHDGLRIPET